MCALVVVAYFPVVFLGRTLSTAPMQPGMQGCGTRTGACVPYQNDDQRVDPLASAVALEPWGHVDDRVLRARRPAAVEPVPGHRRAARGQHAECAVRPGDARVPPAPDAARRGHHLPRRAAPHRGSPRTSAARVIGLQWIAATVAGGAFVLSGWFFVYGNNQWIHTYLYLPLIVVSVEWILRTKRLLPVLLLGLSITGMVLTGMPEPMFMALCASALYAARAAVRRDRGHGAGHGPRC